MKSKGLFLAVLAWSLSASAQPAHTHGQASTEPPPKEPLVDNLGSYHRTITTRSPEAQRYFDQGLRLLFSFNLEEAQQSFEAAARLDPECAMCVWGVGMSLGPHINLAGIPDRTRAGHQAAQWAVALAKKSTPAEKALIEALAKRFSDPPPADPAGQSALDTRYAEAMRGVLKRFPDDVDVAVLTAEALMDLHPWDLWTLEGKAQPWTAEIVTLLEQALAKDPSHPGANHYYIHAVEASPHPEKALAAASRVGTLVPGAAHMVHMPSHIYARVGRWADASESNRQAIAVDRDYLGTASGLGFYFMYAAHNFQFLWFTSLMSGQGAAALENARAVVAQSPVEMLQQMPGYDFLLGYPIWTLVRMGRWNDVLAEPAPPLGFPYVRAVWHGARAIAHMALGREDEAVAERANMVRAAEEVPAEALQGLNPARTLLGVAVGIVDGRLASARGMTDEAFERLREAVRLEDTLRYNEPPDWYYPARHELGAVLAAAGQFSEAQKVWEEDLRRNPENGWALAGLAEALRGQQKEKEAVAVQERFEKAWKGADITLRP